MEDQPQEILYCIFDYIVGSFILSVKNELIKCFPCGGCYKDRRYLAEAYEENAAGLMLVNKFFYKIVCNYLEQRGAELDLNSVLCYTEAGRSIDFRSKNFCTEGKDDILIDVKNSQKYLYKNVKYIKKIYFTRAMLKKDLFLRPHSSIKINNFNICDNYNFRGNEFILYKILFSYGDDNDDLRAIDIKINSLIISFYNIISFSIIDQIFVITIYLKYKSDHIKPISFEIEPNLNLEKIKTFIWRIGKNNLNILLESFSIILKLDFMKKKLFYNSINNLFLTLKYFTIEK